MSIQTNFPAIKPTLLLDFANTKQLDPRITFTRASTATYYGTQTAKAEENLLTYSQEFDNAAWTKGANITLTANGATAPDGTSTAEVFSASANTDLAANRISSGNAGSIAGTYTFSIWMRAATSQNILLRGVENSGVTFVSSTAAAVTSTWTRFTHTFTITTPNARITLGSNGTDTPTNVEIWGAQLEQRSAATAYTPTTTQPITNYIPQLLTAASGVARFDHNPTTFESLGLEIEEQRTNLLLQSEDFSTTWSNSASSEQTNVIVSPAGTLTGDKLVEDSTTAAHYVVQAVSAITGAYTLTCYIKAAERTNAMFVVAGGTTARAVGFNLTTGATYAEAIGGVSPPDLTSDMTSVGNGWWRCRMSWTADGQTSMRIYTDSGSGTGSTTGDGYSGIYIWGAQLEEGAFATSYIPTVASQVTRSADAASMTGTNFSSWYNQAEGSFYSDFAFTGLTGVSGQRVFQADDGSNSNYLAINATSVASMQNPIVRGGNTEATLPTPATTFIANTFNKIAVGFANNNSVAAVNNVLGTTDTSCLLPLSLTALRFGASATSISSNLLIRKLAYYPLRVTNAQLQALTS
jgi:hypothetical protein